MTKQNLTMQSVFCAGLVAMIATGCGQKSGDNSPAQGPAAVAPVTQPQAPATAAPAPAPIPAPAPVNNGQGSSTNALPQTPAPTPIAPTVYAPQQVGDMFMVNIPQGFHPVYRSSTFDIPGYLKYDYINGGRQVDTAAPFALTCQPGANFQSLEPMPTISGVSRDFCAMTPPLSFNAPADPMLNPFRWMTNSTVSYNSIAIASDNSFDFSSAPASLQPALAKMYINVFTNVAGVTGTAFQNQFATELSQTASRMNLACAGQIPQYMGEAAVFQGFFSWSVASAPMFGCSTMRNGAWYVEVGSFPLDTVAQITPQQGWTSWIGQSFASSKRAAEIVIEVGPYPQAPAPIGFAQQAQNMMLQNIQKLLPSTLPAGNGNANGSQGQWNGNRGGRGNGGFHGSNGTWIPPMNH